MIADAHISSRSREQRSSNPRHESDQKGRQKDKDRDAQRDKPGEISPNVIEIAIDPSLVNDQDREIAIARDQTDPGRGQHDRARPDAGRASPRGRHGHDRHDRCP
jgi:hypothetical protein